MAGRFGSKLGWGPGLTGMVLLTRVLPRYRWRRRLGIGVHSFVADLAGHPAAIARDIAWFQAQTGRLPRSLLELGPGDSLANAIHAAALGVQRIWLADTGDYISHDMDSYRRIATAAGIADRLAFSSRGALLDSLGAAYLTTGLATIADGAVDLSVSYVVLEHVRRRDVAALMQSLHRVTAPGGLGHHDIDLMDHLGGRLNHLRFGDRVWEHDTIACSGFYTNRLGRDDILALARAAGFTASVPYLARFATLPTPRRAMHAMFQGRSDEALRVAGFGVDLRKSQGAGK